MAQDDYQAVGFLSNILISLHVITLFFLIMAVFKIFYDLLKQRLYFTFLEKLLAGFIKRYVFYLHGFYFVCMRKSEASFIYCYFYKS